MKSLEVNGHAGNHGRCIHENKYPVIDVEYSYNDCLSVHLIEETGHSKRVPSSLLTLLFQMSPFASFDILFSGSIFNENRR